MYLCIVIDGLANRVPRVLREGGTLVTVKIPRCQGGIVYLAVFDINEREKVLIKNTF